MKNILNRKKPIILLIVTIIYAIFAINGLFYWMMEDKFVIDFHSTRHSEVTWMIRHFSFLLIYLIMMMFLFYCNIPSKKRRLTKKEKHLLYELASRAGMSLPVDWEKNLLVTEINGITGSLLLSPQGIPEMGRSLGDRVGACQFQDIDGVPVIATLNLDKNGNLFELDLWKEDHSKVREISDTFSSVSLSL